MHARRETLGKSRLIGKPDTSQLVNRMPTASTCGSEPSPKQEFYLSVHLDFRLPETQNATCPTCCRRTCAALKQAIRRN